MTDNFIRGVGRLAVDRYQFQDHVDGYNFTHKADIIELDPHLNIDGERSTVQEALEAALPYLAPTSMPDADVSGTKGVITLSGGDLAGSGSSATAVRVSGIQGKPIAVMGSITTGSMLGWNGTAWAPAAIPTPTNQFISAGSPYNTGYGYLAGNTQYAGLGNTSMGYCAGRVIAGNFGTFIGSEAGFLLTTGSQNTLLGFSAGHVLTTGSHCTFIGSNTGYEAANGDYNTLVGSNSGYKLTTGTYNTNVGFDSGYSLTTGSNNTIIGSRSGRSITTGSNNAILGLDSAFNITSGNQNTLLGNYAGRDVSTTSQNVFVGYSSGQNCNGSGNSCLGYQSALYCKSNYNCFIGYQCGLGNSGGTSSGTYNIGIGYQSLYSFTTGNYNIALGLRSSRSMLTASDCISLGTDSLKNCNYSVGNIAIGYETLSDNANPGTYNVAVGYGAAKYVLGSNNIAIGVAAMEGTSTFTNGQNNIYIGNSAGSNNTTGSYNIAIGYLSNCGTNNTGCIAIGREAIAITASASATNIQLGTGTNNALQPGYSILYVGQGGSATPGELFRCYAYSWSATSDIKVKEEINSLTSKEGLDFVNKLNPVSYKLKYQGKGSEEEFIKNRRVQFGLIAQEVKATIDDLQLPDNEIYTRSEDDGWSLNYNAFIAPLVKSVQQLSEKINSLEAENKLLKEAIFELKNK